jgi:hypothetical protein
MPLARRALAPGKPNDAARLPEARIDALNNELIRREIAAEQVITVLPVAGQIMVSPTPPQFRVRYRTR